jgi:uncharacterized protein (DUF2141 family)
MPIKRFSLFFLFLLILILGCAKSLPPPGGPIDRTPPEMTSSEPPTGSVRVPFDSDVTIEFSELLERKTIEKAVFITPQPDPEAKVRAKGNSIVITFPGGLKKDRTYVITVGTDLKDAHNVNLAQSVSIAFSTGITIDSGSIAGTVYKDGKETAGISLALFETLPDKLNKPVDSLTPNYLTQSGENGHFRFSYLPESIYYLVAFNDQNKNRRINPAKEMIGLPFREMTTDEQRHLTGIDIRLHKIDTGLIELRAVSINPDRLIKIRFSQRLGREEAENLLKSAIVRAEDDSASSSGDIAFTNLTAYPSSDFLLAAGPLQSGRSYRLMLDLGKLFPAVDDSLRVLSYGFNAVEITDSKGPELLDSDPTDGAENIAVDSTFRFLFSEPVDSSALQPAVRLTGCSGDTDIVAIKVLDKFVYQAIPPAELLHACDYQLLLDESYVRDLAGNVMGDSTTTISFTTIGRDTLGQLSGELRFSDNEDTVYPVVISLKPAIEGGPQKLELLPGQEHFISYLLPGYYTVSAFLDRNQNGRFDYGSIIPYQPAEPFAAPVDTFRVRTRFETTGVIIEF